MLRYVVSNLKGEEISNENALQYYWILKYFPDLNVKDIKNDVKRCKKKLKRSKKTEMTLKKGLISDQLKMERNA